MYFYETHLHTSPLSACAKASLRENLEFYRSAGYAGVFLTDHFIDGNVCHDIRALSYEEKIERYFDVYEEAIPLAKELGIAVFSAFEMSDNGTDFLVYGIDKEWCLAHKDMDRVPKPEILKLMMEEGALIIHAHPFKGASFGNENIRLYPECVHGVEVFNAGRNDYDNDLAAQYCEKQGLIRFASTDNHIGGRKTRFGGMVTERPIESVEDFISAVRSGEAKPFIKDESGIRFI